MPYLFNLAYVLIAIGTLPWLFWQAITKGKYREGYAAKLAGRVPIRSGSKPCFWLHAVSVGEVNLLAPLLAEFRRQQPDWECVISTTTMTGFALARKKYPDRLVFYCPLDFSWAVRAAMRRIRPAWLVLTELELWPNLIRAAKEHGARVAIVNGRLSERSFRGYRRIARFVRGTLRQIDLIAAQNEEYATRFQALGAPRHAVVVTGSVKFDGALSNRGNLATQKLARLAGFEADDLVFLAGSTQAPEEACAISTFQQLLPEHPRLRLVLVPRHPDRFDEVAELLNRSGLPWQRRSHLEHPSEVSRSPDGRPARILLVDAMGELSAWWGTAYVAFVGGSLSSRGGQNMIEPAAFGAAVSFGPNTRNFRDIVAAMLAAEAAVVVHNGLELTAFVERCLEEPEFAARFGQQAQTLVAKNQGAAARTVRLLVGLAEGRQEPMAA